MGGFWHSRAPRRLQRLCFIAYAQSSILSGMEAYWLNKNGEDLGSVLARLLRSMMRGAACIWEGDHPRDMSNSESFEHRELASRHVEFACRRVKWLQTVTTYTVDQLQIIAAIWGAAAFEKTDTLTVNGKLEPTANPFANQLGVDTRR